MRGAGDSQLTRFAGGSISGTCTPHAPGLLFTFGWVFFSVCFAREGLNFAAWKNASGCQTLSPPGVRWGRWGVVSFFIIFFSPFNEKNVFLSRRLSLKNTALGKKGSRLGGIYFCGAVIDVQHQEPALFPQHRRGAG